MINLIRDLYRVQASSITKLDGYDNANYLLKIGQDRYVFKTYPYSQETYNLLEAETEILLALQKTFQGKIPEPVAANNGDFVTIQNADGRQIICRMLSFLEGEFLGNISANKQVYASLGRFLAQLNRELSSLTNYVI